MGFLGSHITSLRHNYFFCCLGEIFSSEMFVGGGFLSVFFSLNSQRVFQPSGKVFAEHNAAGARCALWEVAEGLCQCQTSCDMLETSAWHFLFVL